MRHICAMSFRTNDLSTKIVVFRHVFSRVGFEHKHRHFLAMSFRTKDFSSLFSRHVISCKGFEHDNRHFLAMSFRTKELSLEIVDVIPRPSEWPQGREILPVRLILAVSCRTVSSMAAIRMQPWASQISFRDERIFLSISFLTCFAAR